MGKIIDRRNMDHDRFAGGDAARPPRESAGRAAPGADGEPGGGPGKVNRFTGHRSELRAAHAPGLEAGAEPSEPEFIARAKSYAMSVAEAVGFEAEVPPEFEADPTITTTSEGLRVVSLQQVSNGIEVWSMSPKVWLHSDGAVDRLVGDTVSVPADLPAKPAVAAEAALLVAVREAAKARTLRGTFGDDELPQLDVAEADFRRLSFQPLPSRPMTFSRGAFAEDIPARLVYLDMGGSFRLTWFFTISREDLIVQYKAFVEADGRTKDLEAPEILYFYDSTSHAVGGRVFTRNPAQTDFREVAFPLPAAEYPIEPPAGFPAFGPWTGTVNGKLATVGNNVRALNGTTRKPFEITAAASGGVFAPAPESPEQFITNIFFFCNYMHDFFLMLGFTEEAGNFQAINPSGLGRGADPVDALAHPGRVVGTANMSTRADGVAGLMNMGLVTSTGRHTANDSDVVFHEYVHGVSNRLVGGMLDAEGLDEDQSVSMGEGWSDFFALTINNFPGTSERLVTGSWVTGRESGIRQRPYDAHYPGTFGDIGKGTGQVAGPANADLSYQEVHDVGEIWCAALMQLTRGVGAVLGSTERGYRLAWQAVVDGLKLTPKNPSFLTARDAVLRAFRSMKGTGRLTEEEYAAVRRAAWEAFARFGMGFDASCPNATFSGCRGGTAIPPDGVDD
ncbi:M36 family metallopeptidase [Arthrobacter sp. BE255]|uniref:M36 family metallopeptidase n=1 Tax=Arthrobacter sp. BE255 TaxID=2817721 RepID=UPI0028585004|nr:M36 family metallopeptidase [Arthrobacter sp. BE255]MDR7159032.1 extracellular elastinolytic metalloproteinase [Arthrobacter sp. BE255]